MSTSNSVVRFLRESVQKPIYYLVLMLFFLVRSLFRHNKVQVYKGTLEQSRVHSAITLSAVEREKRKLQRQNEMLKVRLEKSKRA